MKRQWMKTSPFSNKEVMREKILQEAMTKVKSERAKNIQRLRTGEQNFSELARQILNDTMSVTSNNISSPESVSFLPPPPPIGCGEEEFNKDDDDVLLETHDESETVTITMNSEDVNDEAALIRFLGSDHHELLMHQIAEAMKHEYGNLESDEEEVHDDTDDGGYDWAREEEVAANTDRYLICPICRSSTMEIDGPTGRCPCGALLNLHNANTGQILSADQLRDLLAAVYDRHLLVCDDITLVDASYGGLKTAGLYEDEQESHNHHQMKSTMLLDDDVPEQEVVMSSQKSGGLEFIQRDHSNLIAFCSFCGFAERII